jgi:hypothetical protein
MENVSGHFRWVAQLPKTPSRPNSSTKISPETTGETENGRSISEISSVLALNLNLPIAQAAASPNMALKNTAMVPTTSVMAIADRVLRACELARSISSRWRMGIVTPCGGGAAKIVW